MLRLAIIADDLTGALDTAAPLSDLGPVSVATAIEGLPQALATGAPIVAVSTRSREIDAAEARDRVARALALISPGYRLFKKVDSRLKGNIAAELSALPDGPMLVAPAIPEFGRVVRDGCLQGFGVSRPIAIASRIGAVRATIPDTETPEAMAAALAAFGDGMLVGARGLASALRAGHGPAPRSVPQPLPGIDAPLVIAIGSTDPITLAQVETLQAGVPGLHPVAAPAGAVPALTPGALNPVTVLRLTGEDSLPQAEAAARFARGAAPWLVAARAMVLSGGATAEAMLDRLGIGCLSLEAEILPGLPLCRAGSQAIITKSGGFGAPDTLLRLARAAKEPRHA